MSHKFLHNLKAKKASKSEPGSLEYLMSLPAEMLKSEYPLEYARMQEANAPKKTPFYFYW